MKPRHFPSGGGMPGVTGRDARPLEDVEETELFRRAFPDDGDGMRLAALGIAPADAGGPRGGGGVRGDPRRQPHPPERGFRRGGPGTRGGGPPAAQPPERRSRPQRAGPGGDAEAPVRGGDPRDPGGRPCYPRGRGVLQLPGRGRLVMRGSLRSLVLILLTAGSSVASILADRLLPGANRAERVMGWWGRAFVRLGGWTFRVEGMENLPSGGAVLVANHQSVVDLPMLLSPFPRGGGWVGEFRPGAVPLAQKSGAPVVPVYIDGGYRAIPKGGIRVRPAGLLVRVLPPISPEEGAGGWKERIAAAGG